MIINRSNSCPKCGDGHANSCFIVYSDGYKCFSCGYSNRKSPDFYTYNTNLQTTEQRSLVVPEHTTNPSNFSLSCLQWLYKYYLYNEDIKQYRICYAPPQCGKEESLILPVSFDNDGNLLEFQRRFFPSKAFFGTSGVKKTIFAPKTHNNNTIVIVEDYISALRVSKTLPCLCLFGTSINRLYIDWLIKSYTDVIIWLDDDSPGVEATSKVKKLLTKEFNNAMLKQPLLYSNDITIQSITYKQPKDLSDAKIKTILSSSTINTSDSLPRINLHKERDCY